MVTYNFKYIISFLLLILLLLQVGCSPTEPEDNGTLPQVDICLDLDVGDLIYVSTDDIAGFQFTHNGCVTAASGGDAEENDFTISSSETAVLAFSFAGSVIPQGSGTLVVLEGFITEDCLSDFVFSNSSGDALEYSWTQCND